MTGSETVQYHTLTSAKSSPQILQSLYNLSEKVFSPDILQEGQDAGVRSPSLEEWKSNLVLPSAIIAYATYEASTDPLGFFFVCPKTHPEIGHEYPHLWIAAVDPASRGLGIFPQLMERIKVHAKECGYKTMTVCTYPKLFTKMYRILGENGWEVVVWLKKDEKVLMKLGL